MEHSRNYENDARRILVLLFGDIDFDGRAQRLIEVVSSFGAVHLLDCSEGHVSSVSAGYTHERVIVSPENSQPRRHLAFLRRALATARQFRPDVILAEDYYTVMPGRLAAATCGANFLYDAHELIIPRPNEVMTFRKRFWAKLEQLAVPSTDLVIAANAERAKIMNDYYRLRRPATFMQNIPFPTTPSKDDLASVANKYPILRRKRPDCTLILYLGAIIKHRGIPRFVEAMEHLPSCYRMIIAGDGPDLLWLQDFVQQARLDGRVDFLGRVLNSEVSAIARLCDIGIVTYAYDTRNSIFCAPNKVFEYAQAGLAVLATDQVPLSNLLRGRPWARLVGEYSSAKAIAGQLDDLALNGLVHASDLEMFLSQHTPFEERSRVTHAISEALNW